MTRFVYVLPAGRFRWEVRVDSFVPRLARTVDDLHVGQVVIPKSHIGWLQAVELNPPLTDQTVRTWFDKGWQVAILSEPDTAPEKVHYRRKAHALIAARAIAILVGGEVQPHNRWGRIQDPDSYGNDPRETKG